MKIRLFLAGLVGLFLAACAEDVIENKIIMKTRHSLAVEVTDEFAGATTRANYSGFPSTTFETGDAIGVYAFDGTSYVASNIRFVRQSDGSWLPDEEIPYNEDCTYYAYFPYRATTYSPSTSGTADAVDTKFASFISDASDYFWQANQSTKVGFTYSNLMISKGVTTDTDDDEVTVKFTMKHKRGLAVFNGDDATEVSFTGNQPYQINSTKQFLMKPQTITSFTDDLGTYSLSAKAGKYVEHSIVIPGIDLSKRDNAGNKRTARTTANCYLVHAEGDYRIPLIYGNAIKNGTVNTTAFNPGGTTNSTYCANFVNHNDDGITGPWITKSGSGVDAGMGLTAASAELLWQDVASLISEVSVEGDYLYFTVGTFNPGNALIAVKDGSGNILWSWHIWATEDDLTGTTVIATGSHNYTVAPVNLGWVPTGGEGKQGRCPFYQWGRKDPFLPAADNVSGGNATVYNINNTNITPATINTTSTGMQFEQSSSSTIADNIKYPIKHYYNDYSFGPCNTWYYNMWDALNESVSQYIATATKKTIYDPCPPDFCVPTSNLVYFMGKDMLQITFDSTNKGAMWDTSITGNALWFPAAGYRQYSSCSLEVVGIQGFCWSATPQSGRNAYYQNTNFYGTYWFYSYMLRSNSMSIRPVAEE